METGAGNPPPRRLRRALGFVPLALLIAAAAVLGVVAADTGGRGAADHRPVAEAAVVVGVLAALGLAGVPATVRRRRAARCLMADVDAMSGEEFEKRLAAVWRDLGDRVCTTASSGDFGADLLVERDGQLSVVQAKRYAGAVGIGAVQEVIGARRWYGADHAVVVTNSRLTPAALSLAEAGEVEVVTREALAALLVASAARRGGDGRWLLVHQVAAGLGLVVVLAVAVLRITWRIFVLVCPGQRGGDV